MSSNKNLFFVILFVLAIFTRFIKLNWGDNFFFNPDENNMANSVLQMSKYNLNPKFYAYGQFPLYLTFLSTPKHDFKNIVLTLRFWSAFFSCLSLLVFYSVGLKIFKLKKYSLIFILFLIFTPGLIQLSHFGTTESILLFVFATNILLSFNIYDHKNSKYLILASIISGIGLATKLSSLILTTPIFLSMLFLYLKRHNFWQLIKSFILFIFLTILVGIIFSPYSLINISEYILAMKYEISVATGQIPIFYTRQFIDTLPYLFQFQKIFPYVNGLPIIFLGLIGFCLILKSYILHHKSSVYFLLTLFPALIYFIYQGQLFTKWTRFMSPVFFVFPLLSIFFIKNIKSKLLSYLVIFISILPGIYFMKIYFGPDIRVQATEWINKNIDSSSQVLSEAGNVVDIPLTGDHKSVTNFDFYTLDQNNKNLEKLNQLVDTSDYIFIPSRRVFKNQNNLDFPYSQKYYQKLFLGQSNFNIVKTYFNNNSLFLNSENAEETWSVFDNPKIRIFQKNN